MADSFNLQELWQLNSQEMEKSKALNLLILKKINIQGAKGKLNPLIWINTLTLIFYIATIIFSMSFVYEFKDKLHYVISGSIIALWSLTIVIGAINQLKSILSLDYSEPVLILQKKLIQIKLMGLEYFKLALMIIPFNLAFIIMGYELFFSVDLLQKEIPEWVERHIWISLLLVIPSLWIYQSLSPKNINKKWLKWLMQGTGSQIDEALDLFKEIEDVNNN